MVQELIQRSWLTLAAGAIGVSGASAQTPDVSTLLLRVNAILETDAVQTPAPQVSIEGDSLLVFDTAWDSMIPVVERKMPIGSIGTVTSRPITRPNEPSYFRIEVTVPCLDDRRCVHVVTPQDSTVGMVQRVRLTVWRDSEGAYELARTLRALLQRFRNRAM